MYIKLVVAEETTEEEFRQAIDLVAETAPETLFIIQPVTPYGGCKAASPEKILICQNYALTKLKDVRVIPQTHKMNLTLTFQLGCKFHNPIHGKALRIFSQSLFVIFNLSFCGYILQADEFRT